MRNENLINTPTSMYHNHPSFISNLSHHKQEPHHKHLPTYPIQPRNHIDPYHQPQTRGHYTHHLDTNTPNQHDLTNTPSTSPIYRPYPPTYISDMSPFIGQPASPPRNLQEHDPINPERSQPVGPLTPVLGYNQPTELSQGTNTHHSHGHHYHQFMEYPQPLGPTQVHYYEERSRTTHPPYQPPTYQTPKFLATQPSLKYLNPIHPLPSFPTGSTNTPNTNPTPPANTTIPDNTPDLPPE